MALKKALANMGGSKPIDKKDLRSTINWWEQRSQENYNPSPAEISLRMLQAKQGHAKIEPLMVHDF